MHSIVSFESVSHTAPGSSYYMQRTLTFIITYDHPPMAAHPTVYADSIWTSRSSACIIIAMSRLNALACAIPVWYNVLGTYPTRPPGGGVS